MARKKFCTCFYLTQSFFSCPSTIRKNLSYIIFLKLSEKRDLALIQTTLPFNLEPKIIKQIIANATKFKMNICIIDLKTNDENKMFRRNISDFYNVGDDKIILYNKNGLIN